MSHLATWFTPSLSVISRSKGRSVTAASAYRACVRIEDSRLGEIHDYTKKRGHLFNKLFGADDMSKLWNDAEKEVRKNATVGRELMIPLAESWTLNQQELYCCDIAQYLRITYGVAVQVDIHDKHNNKNTHAHILFTTRTVENGIFGKKTRVLDDLKTGEVSKLREAVCDITNKHAKANGSDWFAYASKFKDIDEDHIPTEHIYRCDSVEVKQTKLERNSNILALRQLQELIADIEAKIAIEEAMATSKIDIHAANVAPVTTPDQIQPESKEKLHPGVSSIWTSIGQQSIQPITAASLLMPHRHKPSTRRYSDLNADASIQPKESPPCSNY
jgi:hypothetical protein